jgi:hypothetical protein
MTVSAHGIVKRHGDGRAAVEALRGLADRGSGFSVRIDLLALRR